MKSARKSSLVFYFIFIILLILSWLYHKDVTNFKSPSELWSDRAGYYIYLPALFFYQFDTHRMPPDLDIATGGGFSIDTVKNKLDTKYTYGVALLQSPFFLTAHLISKITGIDEEDGFSLIYMRMLQLAAILYLFAGLLFLYRSLEIWFGPFISILTTLIIFTATNLFYYSVIDGMMSHGYSFFLFSLILYSLFTYHRTGHEKYLLVSALAIALAVLIRPTNLLAVLFLMLPGIENQNPGLSGLKKILKTRFILFLVLFSFLLFLPQLVYWKYLSGHWLYFSYRDDGFRNLTNPAILQVLFSPVNGLITFTPVVLMMIAGLGVMFFRKKPGSGIILLVFILVTLVCSSWSMWYFGCGYGQRSYIEYFTILSIPMGWLLDSVFRQKYLWVKVLILTVILGMAYVNIRYVSAFYRFERCWFGATWDWDQYRRTFEKAGILPEIHQVKNYENDFENLALFPPGKPSRFFTRSGQYSLDSRLMKGKPVLWTARQFEFGYPWPKMVEMNIWYKSLSAFNPGVSVCFTAISLKKELFRQRLSLDTITTGAGKWNLLKKQFIVPDVNDTAMILALFIENPLRRPVYFDDLKIHFRYHWNPDLEKRKDAFFY